MTWLEFIGVFSLLFIAAIELLDYLGRDYDTVRETWFIKDIPGGFIRDGQRLTCNLCTKNAVYFDCQRTIYWYQRRTEIDIESLCEDHAPKGYQ